MNNLRKAFNWWWTETKRLWHDEGGWIQIVIALIAAGISAYSTYQQGQAQAKQAAFNAKVSSNNAELAARQVKMSAQATEFKAKQFRRRMQAVKGAQTTGFAKAGVVQAGTPLYVGAETEQQIDLDTLAIQYAGNIEQAEILAKEAEQRQMASLYKMQGKSASQAGWYGAGSSLLSGLGQAIVATSKK